MENAVLTQACSSVHRVAVNRDVRTAPAPMPIAFAIRRRMFSLLSLACSYWSPNHSKWPMPVPAPYPNRCARVRHKLRSVSASTLDLMSRRWFEHWFPFPLSVIAFVQNHIRVHWKWQWSVVSVWYIDFHLHCFWAYLSSAVVSSPVTSCSTCNIDMCDGICNCLPAIIRSSVVLPNPLRPTSPYRRPAANSRSAFCSSTLLPNDTSKFSMRMSIDRFVPFASICVSFLLITCEAVAVCSCSGTTGAFGASERFSCFCCNFCWAFSSFFESTFYITAPSWWN